ncbi:MAG: putative peptidoglycan glycosyltransferase FtsW [Pseudomonadota bacterium]
MRFDRTNTTLIGKWWWTIDRSAFFAVAMLIIIGGVMVTAASPAVALRIGAEKFHFIHRQEIFLFLSLLVILLVSMQSPQNIKRLAIIGFICSVILMMALPFVGMETKGAKRWLTLVGVSIQPSEFLKPFMAIITALIFNLRNRPFPIPPWIIATGVYFCVIILLLIQPDLGMAITVSAMWGLQFFLAGLPVIFVILLPILGVAGIFGAYHIFSHVKKRIDNFLDPASGDNYQVEKSLEAFNSGGWFGQGMGEGKVKLQLPDSHTDFVFAVAGEEFGIIVCILIASIFAFIVVRGMWNLSKEHDFFTIVAVSGLLAQFGVQSIINMGVAVNLLPAKGMTLPFLSYGGSSLIAIAIGMGMMLALTRKRYGNVVIKR